MKRTAEEIAKAIRESDYWNREDLHDLCEIAGLEEEFEASDGDSFEEVAYRAAGILGVII